jgi:hypothetical protein
VKQEALTAVAQYLRDELQFDFLEDIVADDFLPDYPRFAVSYHIYSIANNHRIRLRVWVEDPEEGPQRPPPSGPSPVGWKPKCTTSWVSNSRATTACAASSCPKIGKATRCAKITRSATKKSNSPLTGSRLTRGSRMRKIENVKSKA